MQSNMSINKKKCILVEKIKRRDCEITLLRKHLPAVIHPITQKITTDVNLIITDKLQVELGGIPLLYHT